jgi:hypothetical protein
LLEVLWLNRGWLQLAAILVLVLLALRRGGGPERCVAATFVAMFLLDRLYHLIVTGGTAIWTMSDYNRVDVGHLGIDILATASFVAIALTANRIYPLWIAGMQLVALTSYFSRSVIPDLHPVAYAMLERGPSWLQIAGFAAGMVAHLWRTRRRKAYRCWRT